jgi:hypothetical protein
MTPVPVAGAATFRTVMADTGNPAAFDTAYAKLLWKAIVCATANVTPLTVWVTCNTKNGTYPTKDAVLNDGFAVGCDVGWPDGDVGLLVGCRVGCCDGCCVGCSVGCPVGRLVANGNE